MKTVMNMGSFRIYTRVAWTGLHLGNGKEMLRDQLTEEGDATWYWQRKESERLTFVTSRRKESLQASASSQGRGRLPHLVLRSNLEVQHNTFQLLEE
jgi:hypothetical protein